MGGRRIYTIRFKNLDLGKLLGDAIPELNGRELAFAEGKMEAVPGGVSGRYKRHREMVFRFAFLLDLAGIRA